MTSPTDGRHARAWRERRSLSVKELSDLTGFSSESIYRFERGLSSPRTWSNRPDKMPAGPIPERAWQRYFAACAGVDAFLSGRKFNWGRRQ